MEWIAAGVVLGLLIVLGAYLGSPAVVGRAGEARVARALDRALSAADYAVFNDIMLPSGEGTTQIDHVVLSRYGVFVIETKAMSGWIFGGEDQRQWTQAFPKKKVKFQNPLRQNFKHIKAIEAYLGVPSDRMHNVVAFVGSAQPRTDFPPHVVWSTKRLTRFILAQGSQVISPGDLSDYRRKLADPSLVTTKEMVKAHVTDLSRVAADRRAPDRCPRCGNKLVQRTAMKDGRTFLGCVRFPDCRGTRSLR